MSHFNWFLGKSFALDSKSSKCVYTTGLMKEFSLEILICNTYEYRKDCSLVLQDQMSNDLLKFKFYGAYCIENNVTQMCTFIGIYLGSTLLYEIPKKTNTFVYLIYKNNKLYGYYIPTKNIIEENEINAVVDSLEKANAIEMFSIEAELNPYQIEFTNTADDISYYWSMYLLRISNNANDLYYVK